MVHGYLDNEPGSDQLPGDIPQPAAIVRVVERRLHFHLDGWAADQALWPEELVSAGLGAGGREQDGQRSGIRCRRYADV
ncbi:MAG: hypothetical protein JWQ43_2191 [Glaciihabitans sp.]|nr:hypothetical protein [Glaciihabitans sp.]